MKDFWSHIRTAALVFVLAQALLLFTLLSGKVVFLDLRNTQEGFSVEIGTRPPREAPKPRPAPPPSGPPPVAEGQERHPRPQTPVF